VIPGFPLAFAQPLVLLGLLALPVLWWLLRLIPPRPRRVDFPPTRMLFDIAPREETPARTPWWLTLLRLLLAALVIIAAAGPLWNPSLTTSGRGAPLALLIDDGWTAASTWDARMRTAEDLVAQAEVNNRGIALVPLSQSTRDISVGTAGAAQVELQKLVPKPYALKRSDALPMIAQLVGRVPDIDVVWLSDGIDLGKGRAFVAALARTLGRHKLTIVEGGLPPAHALAAADNAAGGLTVKVLRAGGGVQTGTVRALDLKGLPLGEAPFSFKLGDSETSAKFELPVEIRNDIARLEIAGERSAGAVQLLDKRSRRHTVGIVSGATAEAAEPLLAPTYYLSRALNPFADVRLAESAAASEAVAQFLDQKVPVIVLADLGNIPGAVHERLSRWVEAGGVLLRFAGPHLAAAADDDLIPVKLRRGGRTLGGALSWDKPQHLAAFSPDSPFNGMKVPDDVTVKRQVLAEPDSELTDHTWATLADGTPLVTAAQHGKGLILLFHVTADTRWSDLPLSGTFVEMLKRVVALASSPAATPTQADKQAAPDVLPPTHVLDGFGAFVPPPSTARPIPVNFSAHADAEHPPGFYGPPDAMIAVNALAPADRLAPLDFSALNASHEPYRSAEPQDVRGPILLAALALLLLDALVVFWLAGGIARLTQRRRPASAAIMLAIFTALLAAAPRAHAQSSDDFAVKATQQTHLAYVITGDAEVDRVSKLGLEGLTLFLTQRTALEPGEPMGLDIAHDELAFFPLIYWPVVPGAPKPSAEALQRIDAYMKQGGTVLFDTKDAIEAPLGPGGESRGPGMMALRDILSSLEIPELQPVSSQHVLTKTFYLLRDFPGRFTSGRLWAEALPPADADHSDRPARAGDGVSSILITSNDFAGAWAIQPDGEPLLPLMPGEPRQREFAFRAGVNIVMYTLTGNYKADQVHVPALLERLGQ
jgi:Domain of unknown function (DUF4159)/Aerotolerance regulator N-terminal